MRESVRTASRIWPAQFLSRSSSPTRRRSRRPGCNSGARRSTAESAKRPQRLWIGRRVLAAVVTTLAAAACGNGAAPAPSDPFATEGTGSWGPVAVAPADADPVLPQMFFTGTEVLLASNGLFSYDPA